MFYIVLQFSPMLFNYLLVLTDSGPRPYDVNNDSCKDFGYGGSNEPTTQLDQAAILEISTDNISGTSRPINVVFEVPIFSSTGVKITSQNQG